MRYPKAYIQLVLRSYFWSAFRWFVGGIAAGVLLIVGTGAFFVWRANEREVKDIAQLAPPAGRLVKAGDIQAFVQEDGPEKGPVVVFVHGTGAWSGTWRRTLSAAAAEGLHVLALDLPPFGFSNRPESGIYDKVTQGQRIAGLLETLDVTRAILVAHSFGAGPAMEAALQARGRVQGLVLVNAALNVRAPGEEMQPPPALLKKALEMETVRDAVVATVLTNPMFTRTLLRSFMVDPAKADDDWVRIFQKPLELKGSTEAISQWLPALLVPPAEALSEEPGTYLGLRMPVALFWGVHDTIAPIAQGRALVTLIPHAELFAFEGVGHFPQIEDGERFDHLLIDLLKRWAANR